jgi:hypothetical protein
MTRADFDDFAERHQNIEYQFGEQGDCILFRNIDLPWYQENSDRCTRIEQTKMRTMTESELLTAINKGLDVECITRITGYFAKTRSFNPGKQAELKDRERTPLV